MLYSHEGDALRAQMAENQTKQVQQIIVDECLLAGPSSLARMVSVYWQVLESVAAACKKWAAQANARIGEMKCVGGTDVQLGLLQAAKEAEAATVRAAEEVKAGASMAEQAMAAQLKSTKKDLEAAARARVEAELTSAEEEQKAIKRCRCVPL